MFHQGMDASRLAVPSGQAPQPRERCAEGAGLDGAGADRTTIRRAEMMSESSRTGVARCGTRGRSPGGDSLLFALRRGGRRRMGEVGAGRSHPHSRRRTESRAHQAGSRARVPPRPSLAGERYRRLQHRDGGSSEKVGAMPARFRPMPPNAATGIPARRSTAEPSGSCGKRLGLKLAAPSAREAKSGTLHRSTPLRPKNCWPSVTASHWPSFSSNAIPR